jgi:serine/threonine-protein kinase
VRGIPVRAEGPTPVYFFYRRSPTPLTPLFDGFGDSLLVSDANPPLTVPGMAGVALSPDGRLLGFSTVIQSALGSDGTTNPIDWGPWFEQAKLDLQEKFEVDPSGPQFLCPVFCTREFAWKMKPGLGDCRVEAATYRDRPVYFRVTGPWHRTAAWAKSRTDQESFWAKAARYRQFVWYGVLAVVALLAVRNVLRKQADVRTTAWLAVVILALTLAGRLAGGWHVSVLLSFASAALGWAAWQVLTAGGTYLALEPDLRRRWPWRLTGWVRLLSGRFRDPLVGRDLLVGVACQLLILLVYSAGGMIAASLGTPAGFEPTVSPEGFDPAEAFGVTAPASIRLLTLVGRMGYALISLCTAFVLYLLVRREVLAWGAFFLVFVSLDMLMNWSSSWSGNGLQLVYVLVKWGLKVLLLTRFGLLAAAASTATAMLVSLSPLTLQTSAWYFWDGAFMAAVVLGVAGFCCYTAVGGPRLFKEELLGKE